MASTLVAVIVHLEVQVEAVVPAIADLVRSERKFVGLSVAVRSLLFERFQHLVTCRSTTSGPWNNGSSR